MLVHCAEMRSGHLTSRVSCPSVSCSHIPLESSLDNCASSESYFVSTVSQLKTEAEQHWTSLSNSCLTARRNQRGLLVAVCPAFAAESSLVVETATVGCTFLLFAVFWFFSQIFRCYTYIYIFNKFAFLTELQHNSP